MDVLRSRKLYTAVAAVAVEKKSEKGELVLKSFI